MPNIDLIVPFSEKNEAKRLGARWDSERKIWYVPEGVDVSAFKRWLPNEDDFMVRASHYFIAQSTNTCWKCHEQTNVFGFALPAGHEVLDFDEEDATKKKWRQYDEPALVCFITKLWPAVKTRIRAFSRHYKLDYSKTKQGSYWMNHCTHCGAKQGDFNLYCEPTGAFFPIDEHAASLILLHEFHEPFACVGDVSYNNFIFEHAKRA